MTTAVKVACTIDEIKEIIEELKLKVDGIDNVEVLLACASGGMCQTGCQKGCQACQPGNRFGPANKAEDSEQTDVNG